MAFQVSPGVEVREIDLTNVVPAVSTSIGAIAGSFAWGPVGEIVTVGSEKELVNRFGRPTDSTFKYFMPAAQFLQYANALRVVRAENAGLLNASNGSGQISAITVNTAGSGYTDIPSVSITGGGGASAAATATLKVVTVAVNVDGSGYAVNDTVTLNLGSGAEAIFTVTSVDSSGSVTGLSITNAGVYSDINVGGLTALNTFAVSSSGTGLTVNVSLGVNSVVVTNGGSGYTSTPSVAIPGGSTNATATATVVSSGYLVKNADHFSSLAIPAGIQAIAKYPGVLGNGLKVVICTNSVAFASAGFTAYASQFDFAPKTSRYAEDLDPNYDGSTPSDIDDELHVVVVDVTGVWTGTENTILEVFQGLSQAVDARKDDGSTNYYVDVINTQSKYIWIANHDSALTDAGETVVDNLAGFATSDTVISYTLDGGSAGTSATPSAAELISSYSLFADPETVDVNLIVGADVGADDDVTFANNLIAIAEGRKDAVAFISPATVATVNTTSAVGNVTGWADEVTSSSYAVMDSTALYVYDKYNDKYRWIIAAGAVAGLCAYTDNTADPWFSPAGFTRGQLRGVTKIAFNPKKADRDDLYKSRVNPIVSFPGEGIVLYGDKTALSRPSAFDRINVRRLFITLEKAIATAAKLQLFEFNDEFTRAQFRNLVEPFLRDVQGRRGVTDFAVVCDDTNNTAEVIDSNRFVADIYIKPARSINFISLNFIATRTGVEFSEIVGQ